ncbi:hypothetical protein [Rhodococcus sp. OK302]|uniref:hypothetical protein n=1 Tax=Rhodococcus sp. OK302 TaxID=1882769 RepID=UPI00113FDCD3|nr:hypothetical protein [Rhodococcus sp. OK302]
MVSIGAAKTPTRRGAGPASGVGAGPAGGHWCATPQSSHGPPPSYIGARSAAGTPSAAGGAPATMLRSALRLVFTQSLCLLTRPNAITAANITINRIDLLTDTTTGFT